MKDTCGVTSTSVSDAATCTVDGYDVTVRGIFDTGFDPNILTSVNVVLDVSENPISIKPLSETTI